MVEDASAPPQQEAALEDAAAPPQQEAALAAVEDAAAPPQQDAALAALIHSAVGAVISQRPVPAAGRARGCCVVVEGFTGSRQAWPRSLALCKPAPEEVECARGETAQERWQTPPDRQALSILSPLRRMVSATLSI